MTYSFQLTTQEQAEEVAYSWHYEGPYAFYNMEADEEDLQDFLDPKKRGTSIFAVLKDGEFNGFLSVDRISMATYDLGLGMKPDETGKGSGVPFVDAVTDFVVSSYSPERISLAVATFNQRAIRVYRKIGFEEGKRFMQKTNGGMLEFLKMELCVSERE